MTKRFVILAALLVTLSACQSSGSADDPTLNTNNVDRSEADL